MNPARLLLACTLLLLGACAVRAGAKPDQPPGDATVTLQRSPCFGICPAYTVTVTPDGMVDFTGHLHVQTTNARGSATPAQRANIAAALEQAGFNAMQPSYVSRNDGCEMVMTDQPGVKITVATAAGSKSVDFYFGCTGTAADAVKPRIKQLADSIDQQLGTARWIGKPAAPGAVEEVDR